MSLSDKEQLALLREALRELRPKLASQPDRWHIDELLALTDPARNVTQR